MYHDPNQIADWHRDGSETRGEAVMRDSSPGRAKQKMYRIPWTRN